MESEIIKMVVGYGIFAVLFVYLFFYMLKDGKTREVKYQEDSKERESKYQEMIDKLVDKFGVIEEVKKDVEEIKNKLNV